MSKRSHRNRHHGRPGRAPALLAPDECAFVPCSLPSAWIVAGLVEVEGLPSVGVAFVCDVHLDSSSQEMGQQVEPIVAPIDAMADVLGFIDEFMEEAVRHAS